MVEVSDEARKYKINILAIQETRWPGQGRTDKQAYSLFYNGPNSRPGWCGTGFIIDAQVCKSLMCFEPISDRMCKIGLKRRFVNITLISA